MLEKLKSLDKKVWIIGGVAVVAVIAIVVGLIIGIGGSAPDNDNDPTGGTTTSTSGSTTDKDGNPTTTDKESTSTDKDGDKTSTSVSGGSTTGSSTTGSSASGSAGTTKPTGGNTTGSSNNSSTPTTKPTDPPVTTDPDGQEIMGSGTKSDPYLRFPNEDMTVNTLNVPAGGSVYYNIYRVGGKILTIHNANAYVVHGGVRYNAVGGTVTVIVEDALASDAVEFEIGNTGSSAASFKLNFADEMGSYQNPQVASSFGAPYTVFLEEGTESGYYFKHIAQKSGTIRFYLTADQDAVLLATNNTTSAQRTTADDGQTDAQGEYIEMEVSAGDEIIINVGAVPNRRGKYPAVNITWSGEYL